MDHWVLLCKQPHLTTQKQASVNHPFCRESFQQSGCSGYFVSLLLPVYGVSHSLHHHVPLIAVGGLLPRCEDADRYIHIETTLKWSSLRPVSLWPQTIQTDNAVSAKLPAPCMHVCVCLCMCMGVRLVQKSGFGILMQVIRRIGILILL